MKPHPTPPAVGTWAMFVRFLGCYRDAPAAEQQNDSSSDRKPLLPRRARSLDLHALEEEAISGEAEQRATSLGKGR